MTLTLALKREYFEAIKAGTKNYEYRKYNPYWKSRIVGKNFDSVTLTLGHPGKHEVSRRMMRPWRGFTTMTITHPEFGKDPVKIFAIRVN